MTEISGGTLDCFADKTNSFNPCTVLTSDHQSEANGGYQVENSFVNNTKTYENFECRFLYYIGYVNNLLFNSLLKFGVHSLVTLSVFKMAAKRLPE